MTSPKISIIIPTYNAEATLTTALNSVQMQTFPQYEVLIMDGASGDETINIAKKYKETDSRFLLFSEKDKGIYEAMNKGIGKARGEWIIFLGSDDSLYDNEVLLKIDSLIKEKKDLRMIYGNVMLSESIGFNHDSLVFAGEFHSSRLLQMNICHQAIFYNKSLFKEFGPFNTKYKLLADWDFNLRCFNLVDPYYCDIIVANFFAGAKSSKNNDEAFKNDLIRNLVFTYPYSYRHWFFKKMKRALSALFLRELRSLRMAKAFKVGKVLFYQLKPSAS
jgi:glycosyltransferase involved in cell wall biosynthesis